MDTLTKKILYVDLADIPAGGDFVIPGNWSKYYSVLISADWADLNSTDAVVGLLERSDSTQAWKYVTGYICAASPGSQDIQHGDYGSKQLGVRITPGAATAGKFTIYLTAKH